MGRPTKLTPEVRDGIVGFIQKGVHPYIAAGAFGVAVGTYDEWMGRGRGTDPLRPSDPVYIEFAEAVEAAQHQAEAALVAMAVLKAKSTSDLVLILERRFGERWRERREVLVTVHDAIERMAASPEEAVAAQQEVERILAEARGR
jgi:hypothetical protein